MNTNVSNAATAAAQPAQARRSSYGTKLVSIVLATIVSATVWGVVSSPLAGAHAATSAQTELASADEGGYAYNPSGYDTDDDEIFERF